MSKDKQTDDSQPALQPPECLCVEQMRRAPYYKEYACNRCGARYEMSRVDGGVATVFGDPADMTDDELKAAVQFHQKQSAKYSNEGAKVWRLRLRMGHPQPIDTQMFAELTERRAKRTPTLKITPSD